MKTTKMKKKCQHKGLTLLLLYTTIIHGWAFAGPVEDAKSKLATAVGNIGIAVGARSHYYTDFSTKKSEFGTNLEELQRDNLIDFVDLALRWSAREGTLFFYSHCEAILLRWSKEASLEISPLHARGVICL